MTRRITALILAAVSAAACSGREPSYDEEIAGWRADKDRYMRSAESPVPAEGRGTFAPLPYFTVSAAYRVPAGLEVVTADEVIEMSLSSGERRRMRRVGVLGFTLQGQQLKLTAFVDAAENDMRRLFVPFGDLTNGAETYQGGRYLDLDRTATGIYDLDFNRAYHPFCVFNPEYVCPVPPRENRLKVAIRAGEKLPAS
jgi:uncharacterized protein